ncbi:MAG: sugar phosphate isomerase/epimerase family protein [Candidatus Omnitrophota bacterium]
MVFHRVGDLLVNTSYRKVFLDKIQAFGIRGIEIFLGETEDAYRDIEALLNFSKELQARDLYVPCVDVYVNYLKPGHFDRACKIAEEMIESAAVLKSPLGMVCGSVLPEGMSPDRGREMVARGIDESIKTGRKKNVEIAIESFGLSFNLQSTTEMLSDLYGRLKEIPCYFVGDLGNPCYGGEQPVVSLEEFFDRLRHVHVKDVKKAPPGQGLPSAGSWWLDNEKIGSGIADVRTSMQFLNKNGYSGWYSLEIALADNPDVIGDALDCLGQLLSNPLKEEKTQ